DALSRIGRLAEVPVEAVTPSPEALGYRNRIELSLGRDDRGVPVVGYHAEGSGVIVDVDRCLLLHPEAHGVVRSA
ncbi:MAG: hypothetical protein GWN73_22350, partial [Actinobacteria bacterium]|nr:hypothetical protein [Actinomycetota bacterium]NIS33076.1 hypothetical protein [Actinomycetota bacterium]NIU68003.1 hypothetical protein [Actinomycetota bacterium]NIW29790.1 hypothetical protein [Actinomycetota bacterium]